MSSIRYFENQEVDPKKLNFLRQISVSVAFKYIINNRVSASMIATLFFLLLKISIAAISFYWCDDTTTFCNLTKFIPKLSSSLRFLVLCVIRPYLFVIHYCLFTFFKELISFIGSLDKCPTSVFNALIVSDVHLLQNFMFIRQLICTEKLCSQE